MVSWQDLSRAQVADYLRLNGPYAELAVRKLRLAAEDFEREIRALHGFEKAGKRPLYEADKIVDAGLELMPEELREWLEKTTGPMLAFHDDVSAAND